MEKVRYIPNFRWNLISLSRLDSNGYRWIAGDGILIVMSGNRMILKEKKKTKGYYYLAESPM